MPKTAQGAQRSLQNLVNINKLSYKTARTACQTWKVSYSLTYKTRGHVWQADPGMGQGNLGHVLLRQVPESTGAVCSTYSRGSELSANGMHKQPLLPHRHKLNPTGGLLPLPPPPRATCDPAPNLTPSPHKTYTAKRIHLPLSKCQ